MKQLPPEMEERFGVARGVMLPVTVNAEQLEMLRAAEEQSSKGWNFLLLVFVGAKIMAHNDTGTERLKLPEVRLTTDSLDIEDIENEVKDKIFIDYGVQIELSRYLILAHCTFMTDDPSSNPEDSGTSSRTLHLFTARAVNSDGLQGEGNPDKNSPAKLVKPAELLDKLQSEWADVKARRGSPGRSSDLRRTYDDSWAFVRARLSGMAFQYLFNWPLAEI